MSGIQWASPVDWREVREHLRKESSPRQHTSSHSLQTLSSKLWTFGLLPWQVIYKSSKRRTSSILDRIPRSCWQSATPLKSSRKSCNACFASAASPCKCLRRRGRAALQRRVVPFKIGAGFSLWGRTSAVDGLFPPTAPCPYSSHPLRRSGRTYFCATSEFTLKLERSQVSFCPMRDATFPSSKVSVTSPSNSKFPPGFTFPPLHASSHSRSLPGDLGSVFGGCL